MNKCRLLAAEREEEYGSSLGRRCCKRTCNGRMCTLEMSYQYANASGALHRTYPFMYHLSDITGLPVYVIQVMLREQAQRV